MRPRTPRDNLIAIWLRHMEADTGRRITLAEAAAMLGKKPRAVANYYAGRIPQTSELLLMHAIAQGYRPTPWRPRGGGDNLRA